MKIPIKQIFVGERQRIDLGDVESLAETMRPPPDGCGQISPIIVTDDYQLIEGRRRLEAAIMLGWYDIEAVTKSGLTEAQKQEMELIADVQRKDRTWQEKCTALAKVFRLKTIEHGQVGASWTLRMMAEVTGISKTHVDYMLKLADVIEKDPVAARKCISFTDAYKQLVIYPQELALLAEMQRREAMTQGKPPSDVLLSDATPETNELGEVVQEWKAPREEVDQFAPTMGDNEAPETRESQIAAVLGSKNSDDWGTAPHVFAALHDEFHFDLDVCADVTNHKCERYFTIQQNALEQDWGKCRFFCNPPFSLNWEFVKKGFEECEKNGAFGVFLIPARTMSTWFHEYVWDAEVHAVRPGVAIRFYKGGVKYIGTAGSGAPFPVMLVIVQPYLK